MGLAIALPIAAASAQSYPSRPVTIITPFAAGSVTDATARAIAQHLQEALGQSFVVENRAGAGGLLAASAVARAAPDGHTLLITTNTTHSAAPGLFKSVPYDPIRDFTPVARIGSFPSLIAVHPGQPIRSMHELVSYAKANPGKLSFGSSGAGAMTHLTGELFKSLAGLPDIVHVPYRGGGPLISDLISGHIPIIAQSVTANMMELHETGKVRMLCVTSPQRLAAFPSLPTAVEAGLPNMVAQNFIGLFAPAKTPKEIIDQLAQSTRAAMADAQFRQAFVSAGFDPYPDSTPEKAREFVEAEITRWTPIIKSLGLKLD
jgi:tripartite-type tricarboxylate transporter receptor subunit TctC